MQTSDFEAAVAKLKPFLLDYLQEKGIDPHNLFRCPFPGHEDSHPSCGVVGINTNSPRVNCLACGRTGDLFDMVQLFENKPSVGLEWVEYTLKYLANKYGVEIQTKDLTEEQIYELDTYRAYRHASSLIKSINPEDEKYKTFWDGIKQRGWNTEILGKNGVGTVSSFVDFREALKDAGFIAKFLDEIDLSRKDIFNEENIIFTWKDEQGRPIGFTSRNLKFEQKKAEAEATGQKYNGSKYLNQKTTGLKCNIFQKGRRFYGIDEAIKATPPLYIFEGQADVITARHGGLNNCVAIAGTSLSLDHIYLLKDLGIYDVILCLDGDSAGRERLADILEKKFAGHRDMRVRVIELPEGEDPDSYIRNNGIGAFKGLALWSAFEWRLNRYEEEDDPTLICQQMIKFIVNEPSAVSREDLCSVLASRTGISLRSILEDLHAILDEKARERSRERQEVIDKAIYELQKSPIDAEQVFISAKTNLQELNKKHNSESLSEEDFLCAIDKQKEYEENKENTDTGFDLGPDLQPLREWLRGEWSKDVLIIFGGKPNSGKSGLMSKIGYSIATNNKDVCVLHHTIDDTREQTLPRYVCISNGDRKLTINQVRLVNYWKDKVDKLEKRREAGYKKVRKLASAGKLVIKDTNHGCSIAFIESFIQYYKDKYPKRRIVYILDNFHKLTDFPGKDERVRFKQLSQAVKGLATRLHVPILATVEYTKLAPGIKPTKTNIAECLTGDTQIFCPENGGYQRIDEVNPGTYVSTLDSRQKIVLRQITARLDKGIQKVYKITTRTGRTLKSTINHPLYSEDGWTKLSELKVGSWIALPRVLDSFYPRKGNLSNDLARLLGYLAGDGSYGITRSGLNSTPSFTNKSEDYIQEVSNIVSKQFDVEIKSRIHNNSTHLRFARKKGTKQENPVVTWLKDIGVHGQTKKGKKVADCIYTAGRDCKKHYLAGLFATDGCIYSSLGHERIYFSNTSLFLIRGVQQLLLHLGIQSSINGPEEDGLYRVVISNAFIDQFSKSVPISGYKKDKLLELLGNRRNLLTNTGDIMPPKFTQLAKESRKTDGNPVKYSDGYCIQKETINRYRAQFLCQEISSDHKALIEWAFSDIFWDTIVKIEDIGEEQVWDLIVEGTHNFIANDIFCHNTVQIEFDANLIAHLYSELTDTPDSFSVCHKDIDWTGSEVLLPRIEMLIDKNKISEYKGTLFFDFWPASSDYRHIDQEIVASDAKAIKEEQSSCKEDDGFKEK